MGIILVIEDNLDNYDLLAELLSTRHNVVPALTGSEGMTKAKSLRPDLIFLDMSIPEINGWELVVEFRKYPPLTQTPVVAVTAHAMPGDREKCLRAGCTHYKTKPINVREIRLLVDQCLSEIHSGFAGTGLLINPEAVERKDHETV